MDSKQCNLSRGLVMCEGACETCDAYAALPLLTYEEALKRQQRSDLIGEMVRAGQASNHSPRARKQAAK